MLERLADGDRHGAQVLGERFRDAIYPGHGFVERHLARLRQVYTAHERASRRRRQARALAIRARPLGQEAGHARQALLVLRLRQRVLHGVDGVVVGEVEFGEVVAFLRLVQDVALFGRAVEDDVAFLGRELGKRHVKAYTHLAAHLLHEVPHQASPGKHGALVDGFALVGDQCCLVHAPHGAGSAAGGAGAAAVEGKLFGAGPEEGFSAGRARDRLLGGHRHGGRGVGAAVRARVAAHAAEQQAQAVQQLGHGAEGAAHAGDARALVQRQGGGDVAHLVDVGARGLPHAPTRVRGQRLQIATRALCVQNAQGKRAFPAARDAAHAHQLAQRDVDVHVPQVMHARPAHLDMRRAGGRDAGFAGGQVIHGDAFQATVRCFAFHYKASPGWGARPDTSGT